MKIIVLLTVLFIPVFSHAQNEVTVDVATGQALRSAAFDKNNSFDLKFINVDKLGASKTLTIEYVSSLSGLTVPERSIVDPSKPVSINEFASSTLNVGDLTFTIVKTIGISKKLIARFRLGSDGRLTNDEAVVENQTVYASGLSSAPMKVPSIYKDHRVVMYDPCNNTYSIQYNGRQRRAIWKPVLLRHESKQSGVIFLIRNINSLKYDVSVSNEFFSQHTEVPALFNSLSALLSGGPALAAASPGSFPNEIYRLIDLNSNLKTILNENCIDFEQAKKVVKANAALNFASANGIVSLDENYESAKQKVIDKRKSESKPHTNDEINKEFKGALHLPISPDSLLSETMKLYNQFLSTDFYYQSNIIQLANADEIQYSLNIAGKKGAKNANLSVANQLIRVPTFGGLKIEFSTGFYYSDIKNEKYALRETREDTVIKKEIVDEGNLKSGTVGVVALMHAFPRLTTAFNPSATLGIGKSLENNFSLLLGGSLIIGRDNRIVLSAGMNFSNIKVLSAGNTDADGTRLLLPASATDVTYQNKFFRRSFFSFTYSLGGSKKTQSAGSAGKSEDKEEKEN